MKVRKELLLEPLGWLLVVAGAAALILPGPGLLLIVAGLAVLSQRYAWAARRLDPIKRRALHAAAHSVQAWPRIVASGGAALALIALGVVWSVGPGRPGWWPLPARWWLAGGWGAGVSLIISGLVGLITLGYSYSRFRHPRADAEY